MKTLVIAEAGVNHNGDLGLAKQLVAAAAAAGADLVKFQTFVAANIVASHAPKAQYQKSSTGTDESQFEMVRKLELSRADHDALIAECARHGIGFFSTAFDSDSLDTLMSLGLELIKIPSGEITNLPFLRHVARCAKPVILSTGMATLGEIEAAIEVLEVGGVPRGHITVLHCNTEYPTPFEDVNLRAMQNLHRALGVAVGYSDHTAGIEVAIAAVALGATVIEKHFTLDRNLPGPDHQASLEPQELTAMVSAIRNIEKALGDGIKRPSASEAKNRPIARKSLVAASAIRAGQLFTETNVTTKRPGNGISPMRWDEVMGRKAARDFQPDELIEL
jgi:N-acetylneuraminate synthase